MFSLIPLRIWLIGAVCAALVAAGGYLYLQGRSDAKAAAKAAAQAERIETLRKARERRNEVEELPDDELERRLLDRLSGPR